ncbi:MAG: hypothetical protein AAF363_01810 [Bacteroidota bacterium]
MSFAQNNDLKTTEFNVKEGTSSGFQTQVEKSLKLTQNALFEYFKSLGNFDNEGSYYSVSEIEGQGPEFSIYAQLSGGDSLTSISFGFDKAKTKEEDHAELEKYTEQLLYQFILKLEVDELERILREAEQAAEYKSDKLEKIRSQNLKLEKRIASTQAKIVRLQELEEQLKQKIQLNRELLVVDQEELEKVKVRIEQIKKDIGLVE